MKKFQEILDYIRLYPDDEVAYNVFSRIDINELNEQDSEKYLQCKKFVEHHRPYSMSLALYARHELYDIYNLQEEQSIVIDYDVEDGKIKLKSNSAWLWDMKRQLLDYVITKEKELIIGTKHYWMCNKASFVYGAGRLIISDKGDIEYIDNHSGHYHPSVGKFYKTLENLSNFTIKHKHAWSYDA